MFSNEYCMLHIFSFLSPADLLNVEKVSSHWRNVTQRSWITRIKIDDSMMNDCNTLNNILQRCGQNILEFESVREIKDPAVYTTVMQSCPNIQTLFINHVHVEDDNFKLFLRSFTQLKSITIETWYVQNDDTLSKVFANNSELEIVNLLFIFKFRNGITYIPPTVKILRIHTLENLQLQEFLTGLERWTSLKTLSLIDPLKIINWPSDTLKRISEISPNLIQLTLRSIGFSIAPIEHFKHLKRIFLFDIKMGNDTIKSISKSYPLLEMLGVGGRRNQVTPSGLVPLVHLRYLRELILSSICIGTPSEAENSVWYSDALKVLRVKSTNMFTDKLATKVLRTCKNLECLNIEDCPITIETIKSACKTVEQDTNRKTVLYLEIFSWTCLLEEAQKFSRRLLHIAGSNVDDRIDSI